MPENSWTIGSDSSCDFVVKNNTVSGRHCRLSVDRNELTITDLDSTNGTYVNGERISGSRAVTPSDEITLGQSQPMPWPQSIRPVDSQSEGIKRATKPNDAPEKIITFGRGPDNTVVLSDSNVSTNHARLIIEGARFVLEDLGSTNGTSIGKIENKISRGVVQPGDTIFFGSTSYRVADLIERSQPIAVAPSLRSPNDALPTAAPLRNVMTWVTVGLGAILIIWFCWLILRSPGTPNVTQANLPATTPNPPKTTVTEDAAATTRLEIPPMLATIEPVEVDLPPEEKLSRALFLIICTDKKRETPFRIGSGFAIDSETIVTAASVVQAMRDLQQNGFPDAFLFSPTNARELEIDSATLHPQFEIADRAARESQQIHDTIYDELESQPPKPEAFEAVKDRLIASRLDALEAMEKKSIHDVAVIKTKQSVEHWLPSISADTKLRPNQKVSVSGYAFDIEDPYFDRSAPIELSTMSSRISQIITPGKSSSARMVARGTPAQIEFSFLGSPVLNTQGRVVGIYSRPTPKTTETLPDSSFDAALFKRVHECRKQ